MVKKALSVDDIVAIYFLKREGIKQVRIGEKMGINQGSVSSALGAIRKHWPPQAASNGRGIRYKKAVKVIKVRLMNDQKAAKRAVKEAELPIVEVPNTMPAEPVADHYDRLQNALGVFEDAVGEFVKAEVTRQIGVVQEENFLLKKKVEELGYLEEEAKKSNVLGELKRHFGGKMPNLSRA